MKGVPTREKRRFALDHNFPIPVVRALQTFLPRVELVPISEIDPAFATLADWELLVALHEKGDWDGLVTNDARMLRLAKEVAVLSQTTLTLVVAVGQGDQPIRSVGVLLSHIDHICHHTVRSHAQVWYLRVSQKNHQEPREFLEAIAEKNSVSVDALIRENRVDLRSRSRFASKPRP